MRMIVILSVDSKWWLHSEVHVGIKDASLQISCSTISCQVSWGHIHKILHQRPNQGTLYVCHGTQS